MQESPAFHVYRYRVRPLRPEQETLAFQALGNSRWIYNQIVSLNKELMAQGERPTSSVEAINLLPSWKAEHDWLRLGPSQPLQQTLIDYSQGLKAFFDDPQNFRPPVYKKKFDETASIRFPQPKQADWNSRKGWVNLPKFGQIRYFKDPRTPFGTLKQVHLVREGEHWFLCLCVEQSGRNAKARKAKQKIHALPANPKHLQDADILGLDFGHVHALTDHLGRHYDLPMARIAQLEARIDRLKAIVEHKRKAAKALRKHQKKDASERSRDSESLLRARRALRKAQTQLRNLLRDVRHQLSHRLTNLAPVLAVEDLKLKKLLENIEREAREQDQKEEDSNKGKPEGSAQKNKSASEKEKVEGGSCRNLDKGDALIPAIQRFNAAPGKAQQAGASSASGKALMPRAQEKSLHRGWAKLGAGIILNQLEYKAARKGGIVVKVNPAYTSQTCPRCEHVNEENRKSQAVFSCQACGFTDHADKVGATNVRTRAVETLLHEGFPTPKPPRHRRPRNPRKRKASKEMAGASAPA